MVRKYERKKNKTIVDYSKQIIFSLDYLFDSIIDFSEKNDLIPMYNPDRVEKRYKIQSQVYVLNGDEIETPNVKMLFHKMEGLIKGHEFWKGGYEDEDRPKITQHRRAKHGIRFGIHEELECPPEEQDIFTMENSYNINDLEKILPKFMYDIDPERIKRGKANRAARK